MKVINHKWITLDEYKEWLSDDANRYNGVFNSEEGIADDGARRG